MKLLKRSNTKTIVWMGMLLAALVLLAFGGTARPVFAGGGMKDCGPNLSTVYGGDPMELIIEKKSASGSGSMYNYSGKLSDMPWNSSRDEIDIIVIGNGVEDICVNAFKDMTDLETVFLPKSLKTIGAGAFDGCTKLKKVYYFGTQAEMMSFLTPEKIGEGNNLMIAKTVACNKGEQVVNLTADDGMPQTSSWSKRFTTLYNTFVILKNENQLKWTNESGLAFALDLDKNGNDDLHANFFPASTLIESDQKSNLLGKSHIMKIAAVDPAKLGGLEEDYSYFSAVTFKLPKKFNGDKGKYTIDLTGGSATIKDYKERMALDETFSGAYNVEHSIKALAFTATGVNYDIDLDGKADVHFEYTASGVTITKLSTCSLKTDTTIALKSATKDSMNAVLYEYYGTVTLKMAAPKPTAKPTPALAPDGTAFGKGASLAAAEAAIAIMPNDDDPKGSTYAPIRARSTKQTTKAIYLTWKKASGAKKYVIYGSLCGKKYKMVKVAETSKKKYTVKKIAKKKLKKGKYYKFMIVAVDGAGKVVSTSKIVHAATDGAKYGNYKAITTKAEKLEDKNELDLEVGKKFKLKGKGVKDPVRTKLKKHRGICYESTNPNVATVSKNGVVKGISEGKCYVYVYAQNGICVRIKVEVDEA